MTARRALVVEGSGDIGTAVATSLADLGHDLVLWGHDRDRLARAAAACGAASVDVVDVTNGEALRAGLDEVLAAYVASKHGLAGLAHGVFLDVRDHGVKVSLVSPGLVAAGAGLLSPAGRERPGDLLTPDDVAAAVRFVVTFPSTGCPVEIDLQAQRSS